MSSEEGTEVGSAALSPEVAAGFEFSGLHVVLGAGKALGRAVVERLASESRNVRAVVLDPSQADTRFPEGVETAVVDPMQVQSIADQCKGAYVVYYCYEPSYSAWKKVWPEVTSNVLLASIDAGVSTIFTSPLVQSSEDNARVEHEILKAHGGGLTRTTVARIPQLYGARVLNPLWRLVYDSAIEGKKAHWVGDLEVRRTFLDVDDAANALVTLGNSVWTHGRTWSVASPGTLTGREFIELAFKAAGNTPKVGKWGRGIVLTGSLLATDARAIIEMPYDYYDQFVVDGKDFSEAFPTFSYTSPEKTMAKALSWYKSQLALVG
ncbi:MAG TPA: NAD(P)H-binding protein [Nitrososphaerales archaeon]|nr:NAD(P)H-binding protein [Nitrososphaerales archaeon]